MTGPGQTVICPNCENTHDATFPYCPHCGQKSEGSVMGFGDMVLDVLGAFFSFDSKALRSLPLLLFRPGSLTLAYLAGKRETYLNPFRFFLFLSIVLFLLLPLVVHDSDIFKPTLNGDGTTEADSLVNVILGEFDEKQTAGDPVPAPDAPGAGNLRWSIDKKQEDQGIFHINDLDSLGNNRWQQAVELVEQGHTYQAAIDSVYPERPRFTRLALKQGLKLHLKKGAGLVGAFLDTTSYTLFLFLPAFAGLLKLFYIRRKRYYIEHLVFSMHYFSFFFFMLIVYVLLYRLAGPLPFWPLTLLAMIYLYMALLRVYRQSWRKTLLKWLLLSGATLTFFVPVFFTVAVLFSVLFY